MFTKKLLIPCLFFGLTAGLMPMLESSSAFAQINRCGCGLRHCRTCAVPCDCGQADCTSCATEVVEDCGCGKIGCSGCLRRRRPLRHCPQCNAEICISESETTKVKKSCWKTEQKVICIPKVRFPWQKCDGPLCGKTKTVTLLKKHSYECEACKYKWKLVEPEAPQVPVDQAVPTPASSAQQSQNLIPTTPQYETIPVVPVVQPIPLDSKGTPIRTLPPIVTGRGR